MKKIVVTVFIVLLILISSDFHKKDALNIFSSSDGVCEFYCEKVLKRSNFISSIISSGDGYFVTTNLKCAKKVFEDLKNVKRYLRIEYKGFKASIMKIVFEI